MIDTHSHLTSDLFSLDIDEIISRLNTSLGLVVSQSVSLADTLKNLEIQKKLPEKIKCVIGIHPEEVNEDGNVDEIRKIEEYLVQSRKSFVGVGEIGVDFNLFKWKENINREKHILAQRRVFESMVNLGIKYDLPLVIHSREEDMSETVLGEIKSMLKGKNVRAVFHCFTYTNETTAFSLLDSGYYISFTNIVSYPKNKELLALARKCIQKYPNQIMFETDAPYLPPQSKRGERCEPIDVASMYELFKEDVSESQIDSNAKRFFNL